MTMQVGMVGSDGVLLASDTKWADESEETWYPYRSQKILLDSETRIAVAVSRQRTLAVEAAERIIDEFKGNSCENPRNTLIRIAKETARDSGAANPDFQCLVVFGLPSPRLFNLRYRDGQMWMPMHDCPEVTDCVPAGDTKSSALLFPIHYYRKMPLNDLSLLAAHTIFTGARLASGGIGGLEIVQCRSEGFSRMPESNLAELEKQSKMLDRKIGGLLYGSLKKFRDRPLV